MATIGDIVSKIDAMGLPPQCVNEVASLKMEALYVAGYHEEAKKYTRGYRDGNFLCIKNVEILKFVTDALGDLNINSMETDSGRWGPDGRKIQIDDPAILEFWLNKFKSVPDTLRVILKQSGILKHGRLDEGNPAVLPCADLLLDNLDINTIILPSNPKLQLALIKRGYKLTDDKHLIIRDFTVLEYLYENKIQLDLLYRNRTFLGAYVLIFKHIIEIGIKSNKYGDYTPYDPKENSAYCNNAKISMHGMTHEHLYKATINTDYLKEFIAKGSKTIFPEEKYKYVDMYPNLCVATRYMKHEHMKELIRIDADVDADLYCLTPLMVAIENQDLTAIEILLEAGADIDLTLDGKNALWYINQLSGQAQKQIMNLVFGEQIDADEIKKENAILKEKILKLENKLTARAETIDILVAENVALKAVNNSLKHQFQTEAHKNAILSAIRN